MRRNKSTILDDALRYLSLPASVIPIAGNKKPPAQFSWKGYQSQIPDEADVRDWFAGRDDLSVAIVLGGVSGGLYVRDFDKRSSFDRWKDSHKTLARSLPTVETSRGCHVYARGENVRNRTDLGDGELRSGGLYVVAPHSRHPDGKVYRWVNPLKSLASIPTVDPLEAGFIPVADATDRDRIGYQFDLCLSVPICGIDPSFLEGTIPPAYGTRRGRLFELARRTRIHPKYRDVALSDLRPLVQEWHKAALATIRTKDFDSSWLDFVEAWENIDPALCGDAAAIAMERVMANPLPTAALKYDSMLVRNLVALCFQLSLASSDGVFFLSCRKAATVLGTQDFKLVARWLNVLSSEGVLTIVKRGDAHTNLATRFRWIGGKR